MSVTLRCSKRSMSWLKASASSNMEYMSVTLLVSQPLMSWLRAPASENMKDMSVTLLVSALEVNTSPLKDGRRRT